MRMVRRFWQSMAGLALVVLVFTLLSYLYLVLNLVPLFGKTTGLASLNLPTVFPSLWDILRPKTTSVVLAPFIVLLSQVFLTGGLYGSLLRLNAKQPLPAASFLADGLRSFFRLLLWNLLWTFAIPLFVVGIDGLASPIGEALTVVLVIARFLFLFADVALVSEHHRTMRESLRGAFAILVNHWLTMLPFGVVMIILSSLCTALLVHVGLSITGFLIGIVYSVAMLWLLHLVVARYLFYGHERDRGSSEEPVY